ELALQLEQAFAEALSRGASVSEAQQKAETQIFDWDALAKQIQKAEITTGTRAARRIGLPTEPVVWGAGEKGSVMNDFFQDLRYGMRMLRKNPGFTTVAILTLALGIGANTAIFSLVRGILLKPLPYPSPERMVMMWEKEKSGTTSNTGFATFTDWRAQNHSFSAMAAMSYWMPTLTGDTEPERFNGQRVTTDFFTVLGVKPMLGRDFVPTEDITGNHRVVILSHALWMRRFSGDPAIVGKMIQLNSIPHLVAGVLPADFASVLSPQSEIWAPLGYNETQSWACRSCRHLRAVGRLKPNVALETAGAEMNTLSEHQFRDHPTDYATAGVILTPVQEQVVGKVRTSLLSLLGAVAFVLLIACSNVANLMLGRAVQQKREVAIRLAIGAGRGRLIRQILTESVLISVLGGILGLLVAAWGVGLLSSLGTDGLPRVGEVRLDVWVLAFTFGVSLFTGILCGLAPALQGAGLNLNLTLKEGGREGGGRVRPGLRHLLVVTNFALALVLLTGAGLMLRSLTRLLNVDAGFDTHNVLTMEVTLQGKKYAAKPEDGFSIPPVTQFFEQALQRIRALPGVEAAGAASQIPLGGNVDMYGMHIEGKETPNPADDPSADRYSITSDYLRAMRIPLLRGRAFTSEDQQKSPMVVLISETFAHKIWPNDDPIGKRLKLGDPKGGWRTIVGVVGDVRHRGLDAPRTMQIYLPHSQWSDNSLIVAIRASSSPESLASAVRREIWSLDKDQPITDVATMETLIGVTTAQRRFGLLMMGVFACVALLLASIGIYGVLSFLVARRTHEIGIRMALGAQRRDVMQLVMRQGLMLIVSGIAIGVVGALVLTQWLESLLFGVSP
ncbi:MAG: ABC transporter permease, partial [Acidobacteria bacterium]|nr:ABC transporter permease [Acidobacteriota bacterium]